MGNKTWEGKWKVKELCWMRGQAQNANKTLSVLFVMVKLKNRVLTP